MGQPASSWPYSCPSPTPPMPQSASRPLRHSNFSGHCINRVSAAEEAEYEGNEEGHDDESSKDDGYDRDLRGRKHVDTDKNHDGAYVIDAREHKTVMRFPPHGDSADSMFRAYLQTYIPSHMVLNEYGDVRSISDISTSHIAAIQGKLWREIPQGLAARSSLSTEDVTDYDQLAADCIETIADTLEMDHVFVIRSRPLNAPLCSFGLCSELHHQHKMLQQPNLIALEPTVGFMTLDATGLFLFHGKIFVFRRISDKYSKYGLNIENIMPKERLAYCIECLQYLWDRRIHAWSTKDKFANNFEELEHGFRAVNHSHDSHSSRHRSQHRVTRHTTPLDFGENRVDQETVEDVEYYLEDDEEEEEEEGESTDILGASSREKRLFSHMISSDDQVDTGDLPFQLDGANDKVPTTPQNSRVLSEKTKTPLRIEGLEASNDLSPRAVRALAREISAARRVNAKHVNHAALSFNIYTPPQWVAINTPPRQLSTSTSALRQFSSNQSTAQPTVRSRMSREELEYLDDHVDLTTDQPLQTSFTIPVSEQYRDARAGVPLGDPVEYQHKKGISFPAPPMQDLGPMFPKESLEELYMERPKVYEGGIARQDIISSAVRASGVKVSNQELEVPSPARNGFKHVPQSIPSLKASSNDSPMLSSSTAKGDGLLTFLAAAKMEMALLPANTVNTSPNAHIKSPTSAAANPQRRQPKSPKIQAPSESRLLALQRSQQATQSPKDRGWVKAAPTLCSCRKPSRPGDRIVTCTNAACPISTYHYRCLDKSQKLSTKGAQWVCAMCKATAMYAAKAAKQPKTDFKFPFNKVEIEDAFAFAGDKAAVNPYGFGVGKHAGYQPEKYGVVGSMNQNGEVQPVYGVDPTAENIGEKSENSSCSSSSSDESETGMEDFIVDEPAGDPCGISSGSQEQSSLFCTPSHPMTPLKDGGGMQRVYAIDTPIPLALRTWEVVDEDEEAEEDENEDEDEDDDQDDDEMEE